MNPNPSLAEDGLMEAVPMSPLVGLEDVRATWLVIYIYIYIHMCIYIQIWIRIYAHTHTE